MCIMDPAWKYLGDFVDKNRWIGGGITKAHNCFLAPSLFPKIKDTYPVFFYQRTKYSKLKLHLLRNLMSKILMNYLPFHFKRYIRFIEFQANFILFAFCHSGLSRIWVPYKTWMVAHSLVARLLMPAKLKSTSRLA